jgi:hypothetical protein
MWTKNHNIIKYEQPFEFPFNDLSLKVFKVSTVFILNLKGHDLKRRIKPVSVAEAMLIDFV